jgi:hypothetical protein
MFFASKDLVKTRILDWMYLLVFRPYSVFGQNHLCVRMLQNRDSTIQSEVRRNSSSLSAVRTIVPSHPDADCSCSIRPDEVPYRLDTVSPASSVRTMCFFCPDPYTVSRSFCASLLPSGRFSSTSGRYSVLERFSDSF